MSGKPTGGPSTFAQRIVRMTQAQEKQKEAEYEKKVQEWVEKIMKSIESQAAAGCSKYCFIHGYIEEGQSEAMQRVCEKHGFEEILNSEGEFIGASWEHMDP